MIKESDQIKILGVLVNRTLSQMIDVNYEKLINDIQFLLQLHSVRNLNLIEKTWLLNTFKVMVCCTSVAAKK